MALPDLATSIRQADAVVVGTVTATRSGGRIATVQVEEQWRGRLPAVFELRGGPAADNTATSVDRSYQVGRRYLLFVTEPAAHGSQGTFGGAFEDNSCSATQPFTPDLARFRPLSATSVLPSAAPSTSVRPTPGPPHTGAPRRLQHRSSQVWWIVILGGVGALVLAAGALAIWRVRGPVDSPTPGA